METKYWITKDPETGNFGAVIANVEPKNAVATVDVNPGQVILFEDLSITTSKGKVTAKVDSKKREARLKAEADAKVEDDAKEQRRLEAHSRFEAADFEKIKTFEELKSVVQDFMIARNLK